MIHTIGSALKECITKSNMLKSIRLMNYFKKISESDGHPHKMWQVINKPTSHKSSRSSLKELSPNGVSMTNSTALSNTFVDHFSTI